MFSSQFYEMWLSVTERNITLLFGQGRHVWRIVGQPLSHHHSSAYNQALQATRLGFLSLHLPPLPYQLIVLSVPAFPTPYWFSAECTRGSSFCSCRDSPPPTDPYTGIRKESQPILNSLPTYTSSTVPTLSIPSILQDSAGVTYT